MAAPLEPTGPAPGLRRVRVGGLLAAVAFVAIAVATLTPRPPLPRSLPGPFGGEMALQDFLANVVLFLPFGVGIGVAAARTHRAALVALVVSVTIELTQAFFVPGRDASIADVVANVIGGTSGGWVGAHARMLVLPSRAEALRLTIAGVVAAAGVFGLTAWLLGPGAPSQRYAGQFGQHWVPHRGARIGVLDASINGVAIGWQDVGVSDDLNRALRDRHLRLDGRLIPGPPIAGRSRLATVYDSDHPNQPVLVSVFVDQRDLVFATRTRAEDWQLRSPWVRVRDAFPARAADAVHAAPADWAAPLVAGHDTIAFGGERDGARMRAWARGRTGGSEQTLELTPVVGWMLFTPVGATPRAGETALSVLWVTLVGGPPLYWLVLVLVARAPRVMRRPDPDALGDAA